MKYFLVAILLLTGCYPHTSNPDLRVRVIYIERYSPLYTRQYCDSWEYRYRGTDCWDYYLDRVLLDARNRAAYGRPGAGPPPRPIPRDEPIRGGGRRGEDGGERRAVPKGEPDRGGVRRGGDPEPAPERPSERSTEVPPIIRPPINF